MSINDFNFIVNFLKVHGQNGKTALVCGGQEASGLVVKPDVLYACVLTAGRRLAPEVCFKHFFTFLNGGDANVAELCFYSVVAVLYLDLVRAANDQLVRIMNVLT